jgi:multisubunit Na+/H+ antiporter MnhF subunit
MPAPYNDTILNNATDIYEITHEINNLSNGLFSGVFLIAIWLMMLMIFKGSDYFDNVLIGTSFIELIICVGLWAGELISINILLYPLILLMVSILIKIWRG